MKALEIVKVKGVKKVIKVTTVKDVIKFRKVMKL